MHFIISRLLTSKRTNKTHTPEISTTDKLFVLICYVSKTDGELENFVLSHENVQNEGKGTNDLFCC